MRPQGPDGRAQQRAERGRRENRGQVVLQCVGGVVHTGQLHRQPGQAGARAAHQRAGQRMPSSGPP